MRILVTGGAGFIGSHLTDSLVKAGHQVLVVDDLSFGKKEYIHPQAELIQLDIREKSLEKVFFDFAPEVVYHLAAQKNVRASIENPRLDAEINILGALNVLQSAIKAGAKKFIFASSCGIYGEASSFPIDESAEEKPLSPYILNKLVFERYLQIVAEGKINWAALRMANIYGPRQDPYGEAGVISIFLNNALSSKPIYIFGDGQQTRDFVYVEDAVNAFVSLLKTGQGIYNVGTGREVSLLELVEKIKLIADQDIKIEHTPAIAGEVRRSALDCGRLQAASYWQPRFDLEKGLGFTYQWFKENR
ncbi:MAG: NAD-dependent epimerase/dehydratase family protein [Patescibacteria group bacterium]|nr:NAD-dependent epimerase/dehydratase family protein [Patescibacteria group bacterium]